MKYIVFISSILISSQVLAENTSQWGSWGQPPAQFRQQMESGQLTEGDNLYGSGIAGADEKLLHELDQSSLMDYQPKQERVYSLSLHAGTTNIAPTPILTFSSSVDLTTGSIDAANLPIALSTYIESTTGINLESGQEITIQVQITGDEFDASLNDVIEFNGDDFTIHHKTEPEIQPPAEK